MGRRTGVLLALVALAAALVGGCSRSEPTPRQLVIGTPKTTLTLTPAPGPTVVEPVVVRPDEQGELIEVSNAPRREPAPHPALLEPDGNPPPRAVRYTSSIPVPEHLVFILVVGSDARPKEEVARSNADSIHLLAVDPRTGQGTIVGIPRDAWVSVPGGKDRKLSEVLRGGPEQMAATIRKLTGLPVDHYVVTGFVGFPKMIDDLGGVDVYVERRMDDKYSAAHFERGWHHFTGKEALAYSRDRHDTAHGDFSRSEHHGRLMLAALAKMRAETWDDGGLRDWISVLVRNASLDASMDDLVTLASVARRLDPTRVANVVTPGRIGTHSGQSVVFLGDEAVRIFTDLRDDAVLGTGGATTTTTFGYDDTIDEDEGDPPTTGTEGGSGSTTSTSTTSTTNAPIIRTGSTTTTWDESGGG